MPVKYQPHAAYRWTKCHASAPRTALLASRTDLPTESDEPNEHQDEGLRFHRLAAALAQGDPIPEDLEYDAEMLRHAEEYLRYIDQNIRAQASFQRDYIEESLTHPRMAGFEGTLDYGASHTNGILSSATILDAKYGRGKYVPAVENEQLLCYAMLFDAYAGPFDEFTLVIYQPRCGDVAWREWKIDRVQLDDFATKVFWAMTETQVVKVGSHCTWCPFLAHCPEVADTALGLAAEDVQADEDIDRWTRILAVAPAIKAMLDAVSAKVSRAIQAGKQVPGWKVVQGNPGHRRWRIKDQAELEQELRALKLRPKDFVEKKILSPPQLEKKGFFDIIAHLVERPAGGPTLVPETDPRESITTTADDFEAL